MLTIAFVVSALQLLAAASPSPSPNGVQHIDLARRQDHNSTAPADIKKLAADIETTLAKHIIGFDAFKESSGQDHPLIGDLTNVTKRAVGFTALTDGGDGLWIGPMSVGTPSQGPFSVGFDTGSATLLLVNAACTSTECQNHRRYNPTISTSSRNRNQAFTLKVSNSDTVSGNQYTDTVTVGTVPAATGQTIGASNSYPSTFNNYGTAVDGRVGLAYQAISPYKSPSYPQTLVAQNSLTAPLFAFRLGTTANRRRVTFGGTDSRLFTGPISYAPVTTRGFWQIKIDSIGAGEARPAVNQVQGIIDTGSSLIIGDRNNVDRLYNSIPGSAAIGGGMYSVPCNNIPTVSLTVGGTAFPIDPTFFNQGPVSANSDRCVGGIVAAPQSTPPQRYWSIGDVFLQSVYSVFDLGNNRVGFAAPA